MRKAIISLLLAIFICQFVTGSAQNTSPTVFHVVNYMKATPGMEEDYIKVEKLWKRIHEAKKKAGMIDSWEFFRVVSPAGANSEFNFITRNTYVGEEKLADFYEKSFYPDNVESLFNAEEMALINRTGELRTIVKEEVWAVTDAIFAKEMSDATVTVLNYFDFPEGKTSADHVKVETDIWKPVHQARINDGKLKGWVLMQQWFPFGADMPYQDATVDLYKDMRQYFKPFFQEYMAKVHPGKNVNDLMKATTAAATLKKGIVMMRLEIMN
ncbi:MAG: hypothetical protein R3D00_06980 [Bacteroidia bacterium]